MQILLAVSCLLAVAIAGRLDPKIVDGNFADIKDFPYQISLGLQGKHFCSGFIIDQNTVVTAAHCCADVLNNMNNLTVRAGSSDSTNGGQIVGVKKITMHEGFNQPIFHDDDIAILKLTEPLVFGPGVGTIGLEADPVPVGVESVVSGWGDLRFEGSNVQWLREVTVPVISNADCKKMYEGRKIVTKNMICTYLPGKDACDGDSGGPLVYDGKVIGIVSWGLGCASVGSPGVYTIVSNYYNWVYENI